MRSACLSRLSFIDTLSGLCADERFRRSPFGTSVGGDGLSVLYMIESTLGYQRRATVPTGRPPALHRYPRQLPGVGQLRLNTSQRASQLSCNYLYYF